MEMEKYVVYCHLNGADNKKIEVEGKPNIDSNGYLRFGRENFVFSRGSWSYYKKVS